MPINATNPYDYIDVLVQGADGEMVKYVSSIRIKRGTTNKDLFNNVEVGTCALTFYMGEVVSGDASDTLAINQDCIIWVGSYSASDAQIYEGQIQDIDVQYERIGTHAGYRKYVTIYLVDVVYKLSNYKLDKAWATYEKPTKYNDYLPGYETWLQRLENYENRILALSSSILYPQSGMDNPPSGAGEQKVLYAI